MIVAKETEAAVYHSDEYASYTSLLGANASDLSAIVGRAYGSTTATRFMQAWNMQNGYLVDYAIGVVTHDDDKARTAMSGATGTFAPQFAQLFVGIALNDQLGADKAFIDDVAGQRYAPFYVDLHKAYAHTQAVGDELATQIVKLFPDKFPGDPSLRDVDARVALNLALQEHSYLATMATDAAVAKRDTEKGAALSALASTATQLGKAWADWDSAVVAYSGGAELQPTNHVDRLSALTGAPKSAVQLYVQATIKVVDDQRSKSSKEVANDDRAAATAMQPIADSLVQR